MDLSTARRTTRTAPHEGFNKEAKAESDSSNGEESSWEGSDDSGEDESYQDEGGDEDEGEDEDEGANSRAKSKKRKIVESGGVGGDVVSEENEEDEADGEFNASGRKSKPEGLRKRKLTRQELDLLKISSDLKVAPETILSRAQTRARLPIYESSFLPPSPKLSLVVLLTSTSNGPTEGGPKLTPAERKMQKVAKRAVVSRMKKQAKFNKHFRPEEMDQIIVVSIIRAKAVAGIAFNIQKRCPEWYFKIPNQFKEGDGTEEIFGEHLRRLVKALPDTPFKALVKKLAEMQGIYGKFTENIVKRRPDISNNDLVKQVLAEAQNTISKHKKPVRVLSFGFWRDITEIGSNTLEKARLKRSTQATCVTPTAEDNTSPTAEATASCLGSRACVEPKKKQ